MKFFKKYLIIQLTILSFVFLCFSNFSLPVVALSSSTPIAPSGLKAVSTSYNSIQTSWTAVPGVNGYLVYRSTSSSGTYTYIGAASSTTYTDKGLSTNTTYYYKIKSYTLVGTTKVTSGYSTIVSAKPIPSAPVIKASSSSYNSLNVSWTAVPGASGYKVYYATSATGTYSSIASTKTTSATIPNLSTNTTYYIKVRAYTTVNGTYILSKDSNVVSTKPIPSAPSGVQAISTSYNSIQTSWTTVSGANGYLVYRSTSSSGTYTYIGAASSTTYTDKGLSTNTPYYYKIKSYTLVGTTKITSKDSSIVSAKPIPSAPSGLKAVSTSYDSIQTSWTAVSGANGYLVYRSTSSSGTYTYLGSATSTTYTDKGLSANTTYYYKIKSYTLVGSTKITSGYSVIVNAKTLLNDNETETITHLSLGGSYSSAITSAGRVFTWGFGLHGQLGVGTKTIKNRPTEITSNFNLYTGETITHLTLGDDHSSALTSIGRVFTWGENDHGQLGDGTWSEKFSPTDITNHFDLGSGETITHLSLGDAHSAALTSTGRVFTWGENSYGGALGDGTLIDKNRPTEITSNFNLGSGETITHLSLGDDHSSALTSTGRVFTWGYFGEGRLGLGTLPSDTTIWPIDITSNFNLGSGETITHLSLGWNHSSALTSSGRIFTWGGNDFGQLGDGTWMGKDIPTEITSNFNLESGETITSFSLESAQSSALTSTGRVFTWGYNYDGQLGDGTNISQNRPTEITSNFNLGSGETITSISLGRNHSSALTSTGRVFMWGYNYFGQLGDGTNTDKMLPIEVTTW